MSNQDFFAASVNARRAGLQREARASRVARQALRAGRRSVKAAGRINKANTIARDHASPQPRTANAAAAGGC